MKQNYLVLFFLFAAGLVSGFAQTISTQKGLTTAIFNLSAGTIKVYLPDDIRPGDVISGSISVEPAGKNVKQQGKNLAELKMYTVDFNGQKFPVSASGKSLHCSIDKNIQSLRPLNLVNSSGTNIGQVNILSPQSTQPKSLSTDCKIPTHALTSAPIQITGPFDGNSSNTKCNVDGKEAEILAESPRQCIIQFPPEANGIKTVTVQEINQPVCSKQVSGVEMNVSAGKLNLLKGEKTYITVEITGLQNLPDTALLTLTNITSDVVIMKPSNDFLVLLVPDSLGKGIYTRSFDIQSLKTGTFTVNVNLDLPDNNNALYNFDLRDLKNDSGYPGSYGYIGDKPCEPEGKMVTWRWHKTFVCEIVGRKVLPCGHTKEGNEVYEKLKELLEELELDKATDIGEKMAKAFSTAKTFSYSIHVIRKWIDYDIYYKCVNGKWVAYGGVYIKADYDDLGWVSVKHPTTGCWMTFDSPAAEKEFETALENALRAACK